MRSIVVDAVGHAVTVFGRRLNACWDQVAQRTLPGS
jgi:hypothetical protein